MTNKNIEEYDNLIGKKFGLLTIVKRVDDYITPKGLHMKKYLCQCECGNIKEFIYNNLKHNTVKSCGCYTKKLMSNAKRKYNSYDLSGEFGIGFTSNTNKPFYFDLEDYNKIKDYCWMEHNGYVCSRTNGKYVSIHQIIISTQNEIDHLCTENKFDNRKSNLRIVTHMDNMCNRKISSNNTSGVSGVYYSKSKQKWIADITRNKKRITKSFNTKGEAVKYRKFLENTLQKEYSYDNSQKQYKEGCLL